MERSQTFKPDREPLGHIETLQLKNDNVHGPISFLNPTQAQLEPVLPPKIRRDSDEDAEVESTTP